MNIFRNLLISRKLLVGFALCSAFTLLMGVFAISKINNMRQEVALVGRNAAQVQSLLTLRGLLNELRIYQIQLANTQDPKRVEDYLKRIDKTGTALTETAATMPADPIEPKDKAEGDQLVTQVADFSAAGAALVAAVQSGDATTTEKLLSGDTLKLRRATASIIDTMIVAREERGAGFRAQSATNFTTAVTAIGIGTGFAVLVSFGCGLLIARSITRPLSAAVEVTRRVSDGDLSAVEHDGRRDEPGQLLAAMERMVGLLGNFSQAQSAMARQHDAGWIDHRIPAQDFPGSFGEMARNVNELVESHIRTKRNAIELLQGYARGDFSGQSERLPNQKAFVHEALDNARDSMRAISQEMKRLVGAATSGDFSARGNEANFSHEFRDMVSQLNQLMTISERSFQEMSRVFTALSQGNLTVRMEGDFRGMLQEVKAAANNTVDQLTAIVSELNHAATTVRSESGTLRSGNQELAARTEQQSASLEETASSMEELTSTVKMNAENARQANQLAIGASEVAGRGGEVVLQVVGTMQEIEASSRKIVDIISVIDGIAFQTNILALNAAVEAARAGEHGRGFAVVASEVRTLAQRAASAAKEITTLISTSVEKVENGSQLAGQAGATIKEVVTSVKRVTDIMAEITAASQEQSSGIEQVNKTVTQMDETTQQNAAMVEKATNAALSLDDQAQQLVTIVQRFRTRATAQPHESPAAPGKSEQTVKPATPGKAGSTSKSTGTARSEPAGRSAKSPAPKSEPAALRRPIGRAAVASAEASDSWAEF